MRGHIFAFNIWSARFCNFTFNVSSMGSDLNGAKLRAFQR
jgi:hypothetical protein